MSFIKKEQCVTPWNVEGAIVDGKITNIDYTRLIEKFGTNYIDDTLLERFERLTGKKLHRLLRRGPSSSSMHLGHMVPFLFCKWLQDELTLEDTRQYAKENAKDIIACGFDPDKTLIFADTYSISGAFYHNIVRVSNKCKATFGFKEEIYSDSIGKYHFVSIQAAPSFSNSFPNIFGTRTDIPCLIPMAIDQDPYFRLTRDVSDRLGYLKPSLIHTKFFPSLQGHGTKMSGSLEHTAIYMSDTVSQIKNKINKYAFSGGGATLEEHIKKGGNPDLDVSFTYLMYFLENDDELEKIRCDYSSGKMLTSELKAITIKVLQDFIIGFQEQLALVTDDIIFKTNVLFYLILLMMDTEHSVFNVMGQDFVIKELGKGSYGIVWPFAAKNVQDGTYSRVAIKKITNIFSKKMLAKRALREIMLLTHFRNHKNITTLYDMDIINPSTFNELYLYQELDLDANQFKHTSAQNYIRGLSIVPKISYSKIFPYANPNALDLLNRLLTFDPDDRISCENALEHPYLVIWHDPKKEPVCSKQFDFGFEALDDIQEIKQMIINEVSTFKKLIKNFPI
ncbi:hypothetical protein PCK1_003060 [Pneumocystis canis]|nr:hypothetical protein PCK1_003060 [Pneumocystis canis]